MVFLTMKILPSCSSQSPVLAHLANHPWGLRAPSLALLAALILALHEREDMQLNKLAAQLPGKALHSSKVKQPHRFSKHIRLPQDVRDRFVLSFSDSMDRLWLVIDRTNWHLGKIQINILVVQDDFKSKLSGSEQFLSFKIRQLPATAESVRGIAPWARTFRQLTALHRIPRRPSAAIQH